jgi:polar amino acid transport system substrate-binding protein
MLLLASVLLWVAPARAEDTLERVKKEAVLRWGADQEGGGPYVFPREDDPNQVTGFEVDLADRLAHYLQVKPEFVQGQWDKMPDMLRTDKVDLILNGYELTPERLDVMDATIPYYVYGLQLLVRKGDQDFRTWEDLKKAPAGAPARIGVLVGSAAETYTADFCGEACVAVPYEGNTDSMREVETGKLDATLQDTPIAAFYAPRFPALEFIGEPVGEGYYVAYVRKGDTALPATSARLHGRTRASGGKGVHRQHVVGSSPTCRPTNDMPLDDDHLRRH